MSKWVAVGNNLNPKSGEKVLVYHRDYGVEVCEWYGGRFMEYFGAYPANPMPTHWRRLPDPPVNNGGQ